MATPGKPIRMTAGELLGHEVRISRHLDAVSTRLAMRGREANFCTPDLQAIQAEEGGDVRSEAERFFDGVMGDRLEMLRLIMRFIGGRGPEPQRVVQRFYAIAVVLFPELVLHMSKTDLARLLDERKASASWRTKQIFEREAGTWEPGSRGIDTRGKNAAAVQRRHDRAAKKSPHENAKQDPRRPGKKAGLETRSEAGRKNGAAVAHEAIPRGLAGAGEGGLKVISVAANVVAFPGGEKEAGLPTG